MNIDEVFRKLRPVMGPQLDALWQEYLVSDESIRHTIESVLRILIAQRLNETFDSEHVLLKPPPRNASEGQYPVGMIYYGTEGFHPFGLREEEFIQHIGIFGRSGSGKTNLAFLLLRGLARAGKPFLVFDWKRNYRDLVSLPDFGDLIIFTVGRDVTPFRVNPLIPPPGTLPSVWLKKLIEIMCHAYFLGEGVTVLLMRAIDQLYRERGLYAGKPTRYPTMADVRDILMTSKPKGREASWMQSALRAVEVLCFGEMGNVLGTPRSFKVPDLLTRRVILELDAVTNADKIFLIESLLLWIHHFRLAEGSRETFKHAIVVEEAHHILLRKKQEVTGEEAVTDVLLREIRELGESVICLDQHPSLISKPALGNTYTTFAFNLKHRGDIAMIQDCLHLDSEQAGYLNRLDVGWAIVKLQGRWFFPFLIKLPLFTVDKGSTTDEDIRQRNAKLLALDSGCQAACGEDSESIPTQEASTLPANTRDGRILPIPPNDKLDEMDDREPKECAIQLTTQEKDFLTDVWRHPSSTVTSRYRRLSLGPNVGNSLQYALRSLGLLASTVVPLPSGYARILSLTESGRRLLGITGSETRRHGGPEHRFWVKTVAEHMCKAGCPAVEEAPIGHRRTVDVLAIHEGKRVAMEVETGRADVASNIRKCLDAGIDKVVILRTSRCSEGKLMKAIGKRTTAQPRRPNIRPRLSRDRSHVLK